MFPKTCRMKRIVQDLRILDLEGTEEALRRCCYEERDALLGYPNIARPRTASRVAAALSEAENSLSDLIHRWLEEPEASLTSDDVLCYRQKANTWAIARKITEARKAKAR